MNIAELQKRITEEKKRKKICILAHSYQSKEIKEIADYVGDSYGLSLKAKDTDAESIVMCGVLFMAETVKILSPQKRVLLANADAGCPMAEQIDKEQVQLFKREHPDYKVVAYINTTAALKTVCDVCVTSSSAVNIVKKLDAKNILFLPDCNLGSYVAQMVPDKHIQLMNGGCPIHARLSAAEVERAKQQHPEALFLVHPECKPEVVQLADFVGSTTAIMEYAVKSDKKEFLIGTENSIAEQLAYDCPDKHFYPISKQMLCPNMRLTTLVDLYHTLTGEGGEVIELDNETLVNARKCINEMIALG
ncbi:MAG: quinolinate synthase NadA [Paludibacteraceae bacterium]|nr:quinolinate synthase NadA [Paludibacteraceae bacterium]